MIMILQPWRMQLMLVNHDAIQVVDSEKYFKQTEIIKCQESSRALLRFFPYANITQSKSKVSGWK